MNKSAFLTAPALLLLAGCAGNISASSSPSVTPYAGAYATNLTAPTGSALLVVIQPNGSTTAVIADSSGVLASGTGTVSGSSVSVSATGTAGTFQVSTSFSGATTAFSSVTGAASDTNVQETLIASAGQSPFAGAYGAGFSGSDSGTASMTITSSGTMSGTGQVTGGSTVSFSGSSQATGLVSFAGSLQVSGHTVTSTFTGSLYVTQVNTGGGPTILGAGTWTDSHGGTGTWTTSNITA